MPMVTITGRLTDHGVAVMPPQYQQRVWFKPNTGHIRSSYAMDGSEVPATLNADGTFSATVYSDPSDPDVWYTLCTDWLPPGQGLEAPENRARGYFEWPVRIYPDIGGPISDLVEIVNGIGMVYYASDAPRRGVRMQLHFNTSTDDLYAREITW